MSKVQGNEEESWLTQPDEKAGNDAELGNVLPDKYRQDQSKKLDAKGRPDASRQSTLDGKEQEGSGTQDN